MPTVRELSTHFGGISTAEAPPLTVSQRRASAVQSMANRRTSALQIVLQSSRNQEERTEEDRAVKRRSTNNMMFAPGDQAELQRIAARAGGEEEEEEEKKTESGLPPLPPSSGAGGGRNPAIPMRGNVQVAMNGNAQQSLLSGNALQSNAQQSSTSGAAAKSAESAQQSSTATRAATVVLIPVVLPSVVLPPVKIENLSVFAREMVDTNTERELKATIAVRTLLSENVEYMDRIISEPHVVDRLVSFLDRDGDKRLQFEATWSITNIASGTSLHTQAIVNAGALGRLIRLLDSPNVETREQAVWAIGNIAGDSPDLRDQVLSKGVVPILTRRLDLELSHPPRKQHTSLMRNAVWAIANLCRGKPPPEFANVRGVIPVLARAIEVPDADMQADACWALNYLGDGDNSRIQALIDGGVCPKLVELLEHTAQIVKTPALRAVGNVVTGDDTQTEYVLNLGALNKLRNLLVDARLAIRGEACWTISNITAGNYTQIQKVLNADIFPRLIDCAKHPESYISKEAVWAITNATSGGTTEQVTQLGRLGCVQALVGALVNAEELNNRVVVVALQGISDVMTAGDLCDPQNNEFVPVLRQCGGETLLKNDLRHHVNDDVRVKAQELVTRFLDYQPVVNKPPPEMWTPAEVLEEKKRQQALKDAAAANAAAEPAEVASAVSKNRRGSAFVPPQLYCPVSQELMVDPVSTVDGHVYDRINIQRWFNTGKTTSPVTGQALASLTLTPNHPLRQMIEAYKPGYTHRADLDVEWMCVACTMKNKPTDLMCETCGAEKAFRVVPDPDAAPVSLLTRGDL